MAFATDLVGGATVSWTRAGCPDPAPTAGLARCVGDARWPTRLTVPADACTVTADTLNGLAGRCHDAVACTFDGGPSRKLPLGRSEVKVDATGPDKVKASCTSYVDVADRTPPVLTCPAPVVVECGAAPPAVAATCADNCGACAATCDKPAARLPLGAHTLRCEGKDAAGATGSCGAHVAVVDSTAPALSLAASPATLWPPNGELVTIALKRGARDTCDERPRVTCTATSSDPVDAARPDIVWRGEALQLRAARGSRDRVYTISCTAQDAAGNAQTATATVTVPHDRGH
jgi:hypothetical protein